MQDRGVSHTCRLKRVAGCGIIGPQRTNSAHLHRPWRATVRQTTKSRPAATHSHTIVLQTTTGRQANRKKHAVDFRTAAKVFLDPHVIEFDDLDAAGELRFNAIGLVDGRMLFVTYTMRSDIVRIISARGAEPHEKRKYHEI